MNKEDVKVVAIGIGVVFLILFALFNSYILPNQGKPTKSSSYTGTATCESAYDKNKDTITVGHDTWVKECDEGVRDLGNASQ